MEQTVSDQTSLLKKQVVLLWVKRIIAALLIAVCLCGIGTSIWMNTLNRSLWLDEAMLAESFSNRTLANLWRGAFRNNQIAPLGWLYFEKLLTVIFGNTEFVLRIGSILGYTATIGLLYYLVKKVLNGSAILALGASAFYANLQFVLKYSNVFKQYISEGAFVLLVLVVFDLYRKRKIKLWLLCFLWSALIWFSNPVCFAEGGCLIVEGIFALKEKNREKLFRVAVTGICIVASFLFYYFFWLRQVANSNFMQNYWKDNVFLLFPHTKEQIVRDFQLLMKVFSPFGRTKKWIIAPFAAVTTVIVLLKHRNHALLWVVAGSVLSVVASSLRFFPMEDRLWLFFTPYMIFYCAGGVIELFGVIKYRPKFARPMAAFRVFISLVFVLVSGGIFFFWNNPENVYWQEEEINDQVLWLQQNIKSGETVYVSAFSRYGVQYRNGYGNTGIGGYPDNLFFGQVNFRPGDHYEEELKQFLKRDKQYITACHHPDLYLQKLFEAIRKEGHLQLVLFNHRTPLLWYCKDLTDGKISAEWEIAESASSAEGQMTKIRIYNTGVAFINHIYETVRLTNRNRDFSVEIPKMIEPGTEAEVWIPVSDDHCRELLLVNDEGEICLDSQFLRRI